VRRSFECYRSVASSMSSKCGPRVGQVWKFLRDDDDDDERVMLTSLIVSEKLFM